jgi:hypothetical protein
VAALAFAQVKPGELKFSGVAASKSILPGVRKSLEPGQIERWREVLERLAGEFLDGDARVAPRKDACAWCHLKILCRIHEVRTGQADE